ncbi:hypothetical protein [Psychroflexus aestuariivivens]|uniref:hypothetical protein n=1 Tax=Psychroflexus aestuariivivens TaxID=1795040 RepID=UPI000FDB4862|nr:hypothetical protein [Psychroflexus aestuariivivens]
MATKPTVRIETVNGWSTHKIDFEETFGITIELEDKNETLTFTINSLLDFFKEYKGNSKRYLELLYRHLLNQKD